MPALELGSNGEKVKKLQQALLDAGFPPGAVDGEFGAGTEAAVIAYQRSQGRSTSVPTLTRTWLTARPAPAPRPPSAW